MKIDELKKLITYKDIENLMDHMNVPFLPSNSENEKIYQTVCHGGDSYKLYFYRDTKIFKCYTHCDSMDVITLVAKIHKCSLHEGVVFIKQFLGISSNHFKEGFDDETDTQDWDFLNEYVPREYKLEERQFKILDEELLNNFYRMYHPAFYTDGITISTMYKFGIRYDLLNRRIIIPHRLETGELIAIRCRNLDENLIESGIKYTPIVINKVLLSAKSSNYFFGLNINLENIKKSKKVIIVESEKAVMQLDSILESNIAIALSGSSMSLMQVKLLESLGVQEVILALDKEYENYGSIEEKIYAVKIRKGIIEKLLGKFGISVIWDVENLIGFKQSPTDRGGEIFYKLYNKRLFI